MTLYEAGNPFHFVSASVYSFAAGWFARALTNLWNPSGILPYQPPKWRLNFAFVCKKNGQAGLKHAFLQSRLASSSWSVSKTTPFASQCLISSSFGIGCTFQWRFTYNSVYIVSSFPKTSLNTLTFLIADSSSDKTTYSLMLLKSFSTGEENASARVPAFATCAICTMYSDWIASYSSAESDATGTGCNNASNKVTFTFAISDSERYFLVTSSFFEAASFAYFANYSRKPFLNSDNEKNVSIVGFIASTTASTPIDSKSGFTSEYNPTFFTSF